MPLHLNVLVIEDNPLHTDILVKGLTLDADVGVDLVLSFPEAVSKLTSGGKQYHCIIFDLGLPDDTGLHKVRELQRMAPAASIFIHIGEGHDLYIKAFCHGAVGYLARELSAETVSQSMHVSAVRKQAEREVAPIKDRLIAMGDSIHEAEQLPVKKDSDPLKPKSIRPGNKGAGAGAT